MALSYEERFDRDDAPEIKVAPRDFADIKAGQRMLITTPRQLDAHIKTLRKGTSLSMKELRASLSAATGADIACPVVTGIHLRTVAEVVNTRLNYGDAPSGLTPVWRVIEPSSPVVKRLLGGPDLMMAQRAKEGLSHE